MMNIDEFEFLKKKFWMHVIMYILKWDLAYWNLFISIA
jgi:hypothetical protein